MAARAAETRDVEPDLASRQALVFSITWLVFGVLAGLVVEVLTLRPELLGRSGIVAELFSYGRLRAIHETLIVFGWLGVASLAAMFVIVPRVAGVQLHNEVLGATTVVWWSLMIALGAGAIQLGFGQGRPMSELPAPFDAGLLLAMVFVVYNLSLTVVRRRERTLYVSAWYLLAATLTLPFLYVLGSLTVFTGVSDVIVSGFYRGGMELLWLAPVGLGIAYYIVPRTTGNALHSVRLARIGFWLLVGVGGWAGQRYAIGGPAPDYLEAISVAMSVVVLLPLASAASNLFATGRGRWDLVSSSYGLRWAITGVVLLVVWAALVAVSTGAGVSRFLGLTAWQGGLRHLAVYGVFSAFGFAIVYHAYPLVNGRDWWSRRLCEFHYWATLTGVAAGTMLSLGAGAVQATASLTAERAGAGPDVAAAAALSALRAFRLGGAIAFAVVAVAQVVLAWNAFRTSRGGEPLYAVQPTGMRVGSVA